MTSLIERSVLYTSSLVLAVAVFAPVLASFVLKFKPLFAALPKP